MTGINGVFYGPILTNINLYVIRVNAENQLCNARPCLNCLELIKTCGVENIYYSIDGGAIVNERAKHMASLQIPHSEINAPTAKAKAAFYYDIITKIFPTTMRRENFKYFVDYNLKNIFPCAIVNYATGEVVINGCPYYCSLL